MEYYRPSKLKNNFDHFDVEVYAPFPAKRFCEKVLDCCPSFLSSQKDYSYEILDFLRKRGTFICESIQKTDNEERLSELDILINDDNDSDLVYVFLYKDNIIFLEKDSRNKNKNIFKLRFYYDASKGSVENDFEQFVIPSKKNCSKVSIIIKENHSTVIRSVETKEINNFDVALNYGDDFIKHHEIICEKLKSRKDGGLYIFDGERGTGKTSYIQYLSSIINREFIFIPTGMIGVLESPDFLSLLLDHQGAVLVMEDAERAILDRRDSDSPSLVSTLLNMADGIMSSILKVSIIITHNQKEEFIDSALLRKGRLMYKHCFGKLSIENAQKLINSLGINYNVTEPMTLGDIYNLESNIGEIKKEKVSIGFK